MIIGLVQIVQSYAGNYGGNIEFKTRQQSPAGDNTTPTKNVYTC